MSYCEKRDATVEKGLNFCHCYYWREPWRRQVLYMAKFQHTGNYYYLYMHCNLIQIKKTKICEH